MIRDSLGVPLEPEDKVVAEDWTGDPLYEYDEVYQTEFGLLLADEDPSSFLEASFGNKVYVKDYIESLRRD